MMRYVATFMVVLYPGAAHAAMLIYDKVRETRLVRVSPVWLVLGVVLLTQLLTAFSVQNDPSAQGLAVGRKIAELRDRDADLDGKVLIEVVYFEHVAIPVGASDVTGVVYDRPARVIERDTVSLIESTDTSALRQELSNDGITMLVLKSPELRDSAQRALPLRELASENDYYFYRLLPDDEVQP
jgi:hypothetical protein